MNIDWLKEAEKYQQEMLADLQGWIQIPSVGEVDADTENYPTGKANRQALEYFLDLGKKHGFTAKNIDNIVGHIEYTNGPEIVGVIGHSDVVPVGDGWFDDPFSGKIADGFMYGRGTQDDKGPMMASFYALRMLKELGLPLSKTIRLINGTDEESGTKSVDVYFAKEQMPEVGFSPDSDFPLIYGEKGLLTFVVETIMPENSAIISLTAGQRANMVPDKATLVFRSDVDVTAAFGPFLKENSYVGSIKNVDTSTYELHIEGKSAHGSTPDSGINAAYLLFDFLNTIGYDDRFVTFFNTYFLHDTRGSKMGFDYIGEMGPLTSNVGVVSIVDGVAQTTVNIRSPHEWDVYAAENNRNQLLAENHSKLVKFTFKDPLYVPKTDPLIQTLYNVYTSQTGDTTPPLTTGGGTYARPMKKAVAYGMLFPGTEDRMHQKNERVPLADLLKATAIYAEALYELAK